MILPASSYSISAAHDVSAQSSIRPTSSRRTDSISVFLPIIITAVFLLILGMTVLLGKCLYKRFKDLRVSPSHSSWKSYHSSQLNTATPHHYQGHGLNYDDDLDSQDDEDAQREHERLLARRRSTSYYDANRSRAPVAVVIKHDSKGRPISTWSTASSVAAQRGEELSRWSQRRDDLIKIYGKGNLNSSSYAMNHHDQGLEEQPEQELEQELEQEQQQQQQQQEEEEEQGVPGEVSQQHQSVDKPGRA
ncbi:hypothetical protein EDD11_002885 [Mortierella claussenii]|nr:hypothetical protein EDD11_002885 [Mortierella claussenii]